MTSVRTDLLDTTPGSFGETCLFAPTAQVTTAERYLRALNTVVQKSDKHRMYVNFIIPSYSGVGTFPRPRIIGPFAEVLDSFFVDKAKAVYGNK